MRRAARGVWMSLAMGCAPARAAVFVDRVEGGRPVLLRCAGEACVEVRGEGNELREGDVLSDGRPDRAARSEAEARIRALRRRVGAAPLEADLSLERAP